MAARRQSGISADPSRAGEKDDLTRLLVRRFQGMMRDGLLFPGAKLPSERDLAEHFGVARSSLRQALKVLEIMGVITQKVGDGSYLNDDASSVLAVPMEFLFLLDDISWEELMEVRLMVEPALAAKAAERATSADIALIRKSLDEFRQSGGDRTRLVAADVRFHHAIFQAARNRLSSRLFHVIHRSMLRMMLVTSRMVDLDHTLAFHKPIAAAIEQRNAALARKLMTDHLTDAAALLRQGQKQQSERVLRRHLGGSASIGKRAAALHPARRAAL